MSDVAVGIDLGTSNSCVALARDGKVEVLPNAFGEAISASVVAFLQDGSISVGNTAKANVILDPCHTVSSAKRLMGRYFFSEEVRRAQAVCAYELVEGPNHSVRIRMRGEDLSLPEISAMVLREMKSIAERNLGHEVTKAVITVPAYFNDNQRQATRDAGRIAGLDVLRLLNEPTAAALAYGFGRGLRQKVAVYDLGGGTFDISVLEIGQDVFEVLSTCGDTFLGGDDFDDRLIDLLAEEFMRKEGINLRKDPFALEKLKVAAESAKKALSVEDEVEIRIPDVIEGEDGAPRSLVRRVSNAEFTKLVTDLVQRTFHVCDEALRQAGMVARDLDGVILVGGPTRLPLIRDAVRDYFEQEPKVDVDPDEVVAVGAAIHAASLVGSDQGTYLLDVTPLSLCIGVAGGLAEPVIERNTPVPIEQTRVFTTFQDYQESVKIRVYQGESRTAEENELLGQFTFSGFRKAPRGEVRIEVTFEIDTDGIVNVRAADPTTGQQAATQITLSSGLSNEELEQIVAQGRADRVRSEASAAAPKRTATARGGASEELVPLAPARAANLGAAGSAPLGLLGEASDADERDRVGEALGVADDDEDFEVLDDLPEGGPWPLDEIDAAPLGSPAPAIPEPLPEAAVPVEVDAAGITPADDAAEAARVEVHAPEAAPRPSAAEEPAALGAGQEITLPDGALPDDVLEAPGAEADPMDEPLLDDPALSIEEILSERETLFGEIDDELCEPTEDTREED